MYKLNYGVIIIKILECKIYHYLINDEAISMEKFLSERLCSLSNARKMIENHENYRIYIELINEIVILNLLDKKSSSYKYKLCPWNITTATSHGIQLMIEHPSLGQSCIYIPMTNICAIHMISLDEINGADDYEFSIQENET